MYKLTKDLKNKYPRKYSWFYAVPGDWYLLKLTGELIKGIIWGSNFEQMCEECGHNKDLSLQYGETVSVG